ncbi:MAG: hypothetical protein BYD32DRAFT_99704 [Podila humilis]|nr:MAG: hypothetical protein BYD32DRAFT_99704 [Podila humilis]
MKNNKEYSVHELRTQISLLSQGVVGSDGRGLDGHCRSHQQRLMQALLSVGPELQTCPPEALPTLLEFLAPMVLDPVQECCITIEKIIKTAKLYCRQAIKLFEKNIYKYHSTPGKQRQDGSRESHIAQVVFDTKKEMSKAIYALSGTLNHAIAFKESFIMDKTKMFSALMFPPVEFPLEEFKIQ